MQLENVQRLIEQGGNVNVASSNYGLALPLAAARGHLSVLSYLLKVGADPAAGSPPGHHSLSSANSHFASVTGNAILSASRMGNEAAIELILRKNQHPFASTRDSMLIILATVAGGHSQLLDHLLSHKSDAASSECTCDPNQILLQACRSGHGHLVLKALSLGASLYHVDRVRYKRLRTPIYAAAAHGHAAVVELLLQRLDGVVPHDASVDPSSAAAKGGFVLAARVLLTSRTTWEDSRIDRAMKIAAEKGHYAFIRALLEVGARPCNWALCKAAQEGHDSIVKLLASYGANVDRDDAEMPSPILSAMCMGRGSTVETLYQLGAKIPDPERSVYARGFKSGLYPWQYDTLA